MKKLSIFVFLICNVLPTYSQCCTAGNPSAIGSGNFNGLSNFLNLSLSHSYSESDTYYNGSNELSKKHIEMYYNFSSLNVSYFLTDEILLVGEIGYFWKKAQNFPADNYERYANGFGDMNIGLGYRLYSSLDETFNIREIATVTIPIGRFNQVYDGVELPIDLQASSGNVKYKLSLSADNQFEFIPLSSSLAIGIELSSTIDAESTRHKYGNVYDIVFANNYKLSKNIFIGCDFKFEHRDKALSGAKADNNTYSYINATGGDLLLASPKLSFSFPELIDISLRFNKPIYINVNSEQLVNKYSVNLSLSRTFDLN